MPKHATQQTKHARTHTHTQKTKQTHAHTQTRTNEGNKKKRTNERTNERTHERTSKQTNRTKPNRNEPEPNPKAPSQPNAQTNPTEKQHRNKPLHGMNFSAHAYRYSETHIFVTALCSNAVDGKTLANPAATDEVNQRRCVGERTGSQMCW